MKSVALLAILLLGTQCVGATSSAAPTASAPAPTSTVPPTDAAGYRIAALPAEAGEGKAIESQVVADTPHVKSVVITLRDGATLAEHASPHPAIIQALSGQGHARMGETREELSTTRMLLLDPGVAHEVVAAAKTDLVLLVHHMKGPGAPGDPAHEHEH
jgi:quercetin dioxygenase-like cupin family protein